MIKTISGQLKEKARLIDPERYGRSDTSAIGRCRARACEPQVSCHRGDGLPVSQFRHRFEQNGHGRALIEP